MMMTADEVLNGREAPQDVINFHSERSLLPKR
jgi:hypothetical protein